MIQMMLAAPRSGSGKTTVACALLRLLQRRGLSPCAFKCGPDYIDAAFHRAVLGVPGHNLDLFLSDEARVRALYARGCAGHGAAVAESAMGYYDGLGGASDRASAWHVADTLPLSTLLVLRAGGAGLTLAAEIAGLRGFRENSHIAGVLLNECAPGVRAALSPSIERETGVPVLGSLPPMEEARFQSRHLGLYMPEELPDVGGRIDAVADALERDLDWDRLEELYQRAAPRCEDRAAPSAPRARIAVADDAAFRFTYAETLETLRICGAELVPFSPLHDAALPEGACGLYLPGGYPELHAKTLSDNASMREAVHDAVLDGMPTVAECGGFLYLGAALRDGAGKTYPMAGVLAGKAADTGRLVRFGYQTLCAETDSLLFRAGERVPAHEFHYWESDDIGSALSVEKGARRWRCGFASDTLYAAFPHLYFAGRPELARRFVDAAERYGGKR